MEGRYKVIVFAQAINEPCQGYLPSTPKRKMGKKIYKVEADSQNTKQKQ